MSAAAAAPSVASAAAAAPSAALAETDYYFNSYSHYGIHMEMLKDRVRTEAYRDAILMNPHMFKGKVVLDVGCGTGILSLFAAKAGAKRVIGIDCSSVAIQARQIVADNGYGEVITILQGKVEELSLPPDVDKVDVIISEWMGYFLLYESMLNTVLFARDKWGTPGCKLLPDKANMHVNGVRDEQYIQDRFHCWDNVEGIDYSYFKRLSYIEPLIDVVEKDQIVTDTKPLAAFNLNTVTVPELSFTSTFELSALRDDEVHALAVFFDTPFTAGHEIVVLDTAPWTTPTHWRQTVMYLFNSLKMKRGEKAKFHMVCTPNPGNPRDLDVRLTVDFD